MVILKLRLYFWLLYALRRTRQLLHESRNAREIRHEIYHDEKKGSLLRTKVPTILLKEDRSNGIWVLGKNSYRCPYSYDYLIYNVGMIKGHLENLFEVQE